MGNYSFLSSEINVNFSAPQYTVVFTAAHEMAHLYGISREGDANFFAFLASLKTEDAAIMYSAYLSAFEAVYNELCFQNPKEASLIYSLLSDKAKEELAEYRDFHSKYGDKLTEAAGEMNGALIDFAATDGNADYSLFVRLLINYFKNSM